MKPLYDPTLDRMFQAAENVRDRLDRVVSCLDTAKIPHAVAGGRAVAAWVTTAGEGGARFTPDIDILISRSDLPRVASALAGLGMVPMHVGPALRFLDRPDAHPRDAVKILFTGEKVRAGDVLPSPGLDQSERGECYRVVSLPALILMKLTAWRLKDQVHLLDLIGVGLIDQATVGTVPPDLAVRLQELVDNPES